jgi:hypothetical protein
MPHRNPLFREVLQTFLADYLRLIEPDSAQHLALDRITFPDLTQLPGWTSAERQGVGVVGETRARWGEKVTILVQVEPEALTPAELSRRIGRYFMDLEIHYCQPVLLSVLYLRGGRPGVNLETAPVCRILDMDILRIYFSAFGLGGCRAEYYLERPEPVAWALSALMLPVRHSRARHRELCRERVAASGLEEGRRALLTRFIDAFLA